MLGGRKSTGTGEETKPGGLKNFFLAVRRKLYDNAVGSIAGAIVAIVIAAALFVWNPLKTRIEESATELKNITSKEAMRQARSTVGSRTIFAVPFRNRDDDNQYIAVWYEIDYRNDPCENESSSIPDWCALQLGPIAVDILVGGQGTYERQTTHITAGTQVGGMDGDYLATITQAAGKPIQRYWGIVDRDGDGKKEILSIADSTGTAPTLPIYVSLYETATGKVRQLRSYPSRFSVKNEFHGVDDSPARAWLISRLSEFHEAQGDLCSRDLAGKLSCTESEHYKKEAAEDAKLHGGLESDYEWIFNSNDDWVASNGVDFTRGPIKVLWSKGRFEPGEACTGRTGKYEWVNVFKGPLVVNDLTANKKAVAYLQDGDHHREIPAVIFGKRYVWLALAADKEILAIDPATFEVKRFSVPEFAAGIPQIWTDDRKPAMVGDAELRATKDFQLDELTLSGNRLTFGGLALTLDVPADEFIGAEQCPTR